MQLINLLQNKIKTIHSLILLLKQKITKIMQAKVITWQKRSPPRLLTKSWQEVRLTREITRRMCLYCHCKSKSADSYRKMKM